MCPIKIPSGQTPGCSLACNNRGTEVGEENEGGENKKEIIKVTNFRSICSDAPLDVRKGIGRDILFSEPNESWSRVLTNLDLFLPYSWKLEELEDILPQD